MTFHHNPISNYAVASLDVAAIAGILGAIIGFLPPIGALLGVIWYCVLFYDRFWKHKNPDD
jgi:hypothetical protein